MKVQLIRLSNRRAKRAGCNPATGALMRRAKRDGRNPSTGAITIPVVIGD